MLGRLISKIDSIVHLAHCLVKLWLVILLRTWCYLIWCLCFFSYLWVIEFLHCKLALKVFPSDDENFPATKTLPIMGFDPTDYYMGVLKVLHLHVLPRWLSDWTVVNKLSCWIKSQWRKLFLLLLTLSRCKNLLWFKSVKIFWILFPNRTLI